SGEIITQWIELPDGQRFFSLASTTGGDPRHLGDLPLRRAVALACAADHAPRLAYARGSDPATAPATPIGISCRLCQRAECQARALPPIGRELLADDQRRSPAPYMFADR
ncbi:MAG TPA: short-chain fatty acyl-CoA regulator family protein, partial [Novosphingobium sp.]